MCKYFVDYGKKNSIEEINWKHTLNFQLKKPFKFIQENVR